MSSSAPLSPKGTRTPALKVVHKFENGSEYVQELQQHICQLLKLYARMYASDDAELSRQGEDKLREASAIIARAEGASALGKLLKQKQTQAIRAKRDDYTRYLDTRSVSENTKEIARMLQKRYNIDSFRSCEDAVRAWKRAKKLRAARQA